jgi:DNA-directed RNA polymerase subunit RPC12/RpoP
MSDIFKIRCPHCAGKIAIEREFYAELAEAAIECPHCEKKMIVPKQQDPSPPAPAPASGPQTIGSHSLDRTQEIQSARPRPVTGFTNKPRDGQERRCAHCRAEVGSRDRICISCGNRLPPPEPPKGFSQISV